MGAGPVRCKTGTTLVDVLRDAASDASSILAASTSRPEPRILDRRPINAIVCPGTTTARADRLPVRGFEADEEIVEAPGEWAVDHLGTLLRPPQCVAEVRKHMPCENSP